MKIILLIDYLAACNYSAGGVQNYVLRMAEALYSLGEDVVVLCRIKTQPDRYDFAVRSIQISFREKKLLHIFQSITLHKIDYSLELLLDAWATRRECEMIHDVDIVQSPNYKLMGLLVNHQKARLVVRASSYRPVWTAEVKPTVDGKVNSWLEKKLFKRADAVFAPSRHLAGMLETALGRPVDLVPTPIPTLTQVEDPSWYDAYLSGRKYILYFGTMLERKGLFILAEAMKQVWQEQPDALLVLAGPDLEVNGKSNLQRFMEIIGEYKTQVIYTNNLPQAKLFPVIRQAHFVVLPSIEDNSPNSMLEAMALGKAVLGTTGSSLDEFYPPACADLLVPRGEVEPLAQKITRLWNLPGEELDAFGAASKQYVEERHSPAAAAIALRDYYRRILARR